MNADEINETEWVDDELKRTAEDAKTRPIPPALVSEEKKCNHPQPIMMTFNASKDQCEWKCSRCGEVIQTQTAVTYNADHLTQCKTNYLPARLTVKPQPESSAAGGVEVDCILCGEPLTATGALLFSYPDKEDRTFKYHICRKCWHSKVLPFID